MRKTLKYILLFLVGTWVLCTVWIYASSTRVTYLIPEKYNGALIITAQQSDGIAINNTKHVVYDFANKKVIKLKGDLITGFFPTGYLNYYTVNSKGEKKKLEVINDISDTTKVLDNLIYVWSCFYEIGGCRIPGYKNTDYETVVIGEKKYIKNILEEQRQLINKYACAGTPENVLK